MEVNQKILVYVDDIEKWQVGKLIERYIIVESGKIEKWKIETISGTEIVRYVKDSKELKQDGCGYLLKSEVETMAEIVCKLAKEEV